MTIYQVHDYAREPSDGATEAPSLESENRHEAAVALMNLRFGVAEASLANPPSMRDIIQRPSPPTLGVMTRATRRQMASVNSSRNVRARTEDEPNEATTNESMGEDQELEAPPLDSDNSANRDMLDQDENHDITLSVNLTPSLSVRADHDNIEGAHLSNENMPNEQINGATIEEPIEEEEEVHVEFENASNAGSDDLQSAPEGKDYEKGMKAQTNPEMACITLSDCNTMSMFVVCTNQKMKESTTPVILPRHKEKPLEGINVIVLQGLETAPFVPDMVIDASVLDPISMSDDDLKETLVTMAAEMALPVNQNMILVCENAESFGKAASLYAALYLAFRNEGKLDVKQCMDAITHAFRQQCPSCFDENYSFPRIQSFCDALESITEADRNTRFKTKTLEEIVRNVHSNMMSSLTDLEQVRHVPYHSPEDLLGWNQNGPGAMNELIRSKSLRPFSSYLHQTEGESEAMTRAAEKQESCPSDWLSKWWPDENYHQTSMHGKYSPIAIAVNTENIAACAYLLAKMGKDQFFNDYTTSAETTPLYHAATVGNAALVAWMLNSGGDISLEIPNIDGETPLFAACAMGHLEVVKVLILHGAVADDSPFFRKCGELLNLKPVEELRVWINKLLDADICDPTMNNHLQSARNLILKRYLDISNGGDSGEVQEIDLSSFDHGDHEFLRDEIEEYDDIELLHVAVYDAKMLARTALLKQVDRRMHDLCTYNEIERSSYYSRCIDYLVGKYN